MNQVSMDYPCVIKPFEDSKDDLYQLFRSYSIYRPLEIKKKGII